MLVTNVFCKESVSTAQVIANTVKEGLKASYSVLVLYLFERTDLSIHNQDHSQ